MTNVKDKFPDNSREFNSQRKIRQGDKPTKGKGIKFHDCEGFRHIQEECIDFFRKKNKGYTSTLPDE